MVRNITKALNRCKILCEVIVCLPLVAREVLLDSPRVLLADFAENCR